MRQAARELRLRGSVKYPTGAEYALGPEDFVSVRISEGVDTGIMPGAVISAECVLVMNDADGQWQTGGAKRGYAPLAGAEITLEIGVRAEDAWLYAPMGVYVCEEATAEINSATVELSCHDTIYFRTGGVFEDTLTYPCALKEVFLAAAEQAGYEYGGALPDEALTVDAAPDWNGASVRSVMGHVAQIMGCCVLVNRWGFLDMRRLAGERVPFVIYPAECLARTVQEGHFGPVNALRVTTVNALGDGDSQQAELEFSLNDGAAEYMVDVSANPLFITGGPNVNALGQAMLENVAGLEYTKCTFRWRGDPDLSPGRYLKLVDPDGGETFCTISRQTLTFSGGFSAECICGSPGEGGLSGGAVGWNGSVSAGSIVGVIAPGNIAAESITAAKLAAGAVTAEKIAAGAITAGKIAAEAVTADEIAANAITADKIAAGSVTADKIAAGAVTAEKIEAGAIDADRIAAGAVTAEKIEAGAVNAGHIAAKTITAESGIIADGAIGTAQIADGSITAAKVVELNADVIKAGTLSAERLVIVGEDGIIYRLNAASSGLTLTELEKDEYKNYINGTVIVAKSITAAQIAAQTITGNEILAGSITAKEIDVSNLFAAEATIQALNAMDITGNTYLKLMVTDAVDGVQVGGTNLIRNGGFYQGLEGWIKSEYNVTGDFRSMYITGAGGSEYTPAEVPVLSLNAQNETGMFGATQIVTGLRKNTVYTVSGYVASHRCNVAAIEVRDTSFTHTALQKFWNVGWGGTNLGEYDHFAFTFNTGDYSDYRVFFCSRNYQENGYLWWAQLKLEEGDRATAWSPSPFDPAEGVKTSYIEIADDHIDISSGGNVNIGAGSALNVNSGTFDVTTGDFQMSLARDDGTDVVMDIDDDGHTTFKAVHAGNVREAEYGYKYYDTASMGSLQAMADYLARTDARAVEYQMSADEYGHVTLKEYSGYFKIYAAGHKLPKITVANSFTGTLWISTGYLSSEGGAYGDKWALTVDGGNVFTTNCWFAPGTAAGIMVEYGGIYRWLNWKDLSVETGYTLDPFIYAASGGIAHVIGGIPSGGRDIWHGFIYVGAYLSEHGGTGGSGSTVSTASVAGTLGYYGSSNGWHAGECFQGYSNAKGRAYGCLAFDLSGIGTIQSAKLTLHRKSGVGLNRKANVTVYGTTADRGSNPASGLTSAYVSTAELIGWDGSATLDVTAAAQALKAGTIKQLVLYTGETGVYSGKAYSYHYAQFDSATLEVAYTE